MEKTFKPTKQQIESAKNKTIDDVIDFNLKILFCGINPGLYTAAIGHNFGRPGNRFWPSLFEAGFTPEIISPFDEKKLLNFGLGITNFVARATARADEIQKEEFIEGGKILKEKIEKYKPEILAVLGIGAYRIAFNKPKAKTGLQKEKIGETKIWVLPNPSGLNASYNFERIVESLRELKAASEKINLD